MTGRGFCCGRSGQFTQTSTNIPVRPGQLLDPYSGGGFAGSGLIDLNDDGRPEFIVGGTRNLGPTGVLRKPLATILWNRDGVFVETDTTALTAPARFPNTHSEITFAGIDVNQDGLQDLVASGNQNPFDGWYLQIFVNHGNKQFVDETAERVPPGEDSAGTEGVDTGAAKARPSNSFLQVLDFHHDGAPDIYVGFLITNKGVAVPPSQPLLWLNDGTGHFSTLKVRDFVAAGKETEGPANVLATDHLVPTRNGYSFINVSYRGDLGHPLTVTGLLATKPYRISAIASRK